MKKKFIKELAELINKHGLEKEMRDTPGYILAQVCVDAMAVFSESVARRDEWHGFRQADEKSERKGCQKKLPGRLQYLQRPFQMCRLHDNAANFKFDSAFQEYKRQRGKSGDCRIAKTDKRRCVRETENGYSGENEKIAGILEKVLGARVEIQCIEVPGKKRRFRKKPRKEGENETN